MENMLRSLLFIVLLALGWTATAAASGPPTVPGRFALKLKPGRKPAALEAALRTLTATDVQQKFPHTLPPNIEKPGSVDLRGIYQFQVPTTVSLARIRTVLLATGAVDYVEPLYIRYPEHQPNDPLADSTLTSLSKSQYYLKQIKAYRAWDITRGDSSIVIGITDGGVRLTHEDLRRQIKYNYADPINGLDDDGDGYVDNFCGWDLANNDNDPGYDIKITHGSLVAGVAAAQADNGVGIAGAGNKCRFLPLNIYTNTPNGNFAGIEAVVYAADHNCKVINMSWGSPGGFSQLEQDAMTYAAVNRDAVLVAAAGNTNADLMFYPASYEHVLSVSGVSSTDQKSPNATFSHRVDLVAPGLSILTTQGYHAKTSGGPAESDYIAVGGTSFAAPLVAAAAALVRWKSPLLSASQVAAQLRQTADKVDTLPANAAWKNLMGAGRLNMFRALTEPSHEARVVTSTFVPARAVYLAGDTVRLSVAVQNLLQPIAGLTVTLTSLSPYISIKQGTFTVGNLASLAVLNNARAPFRLAVASNGIPLNTTATLRYQLTGDDGYASEQLVELVLNPDYVVLDANDLHVTVTSRGKLAFDDLSGTIGAGVSYRGSSNILSEGGLLLAAGPTRVSDRLRTRLGAARESFFNSTQVVLRQSGPRADQEARALFQDTIPGAGSLARSVGVSVRQRAYAWAAPGRRDFVVLEYTLKNLTADTLKPLYAGLFMDWEIPTPDGSARNAAAWDDARAMGYCYAMGQQNTPSLPAIYAGVQVLRGGSPTAYSIDNNATLGSAMCLADGFSTAEKFRALSSGTAQSNAGPPNGTDVSQVIGARVSTLAPGDSTIVAFAMLSAPTLLQLQDAAESATIAYATTLLPTRASARPVDFVAYPNPTDGPLQVALPQNFGPATVQVLDVTGRLVKTLTATGNKFETSLAGLQPGMYLVRVIGASRVMTRSVMLR
ncbi:S8 family peptidase [Hymenobacter sp. BT683]|uniref:S8 family peptidase n=1 Tax=Hymenobacter jeongseonensis TaxID=2791027 RepID=A0ABS0IP57_9BACT|nr:S8 family peptidase [Hymenobacter jeongseonensis]MBF9239997.1 S8 family peptidase [Hymenobacter jeongseonensis]